jgi:DNA-directed RNA polymerase specialized sigma24 family protein
VSDDCADCRARKRRRESRVTETPDFGAAALRLVKALGKRAADDVEQLPELVKLRNALDLELERAAVLAVVEGGWSWGDVGRVLGVSRQYAHRRYSGLAERVAQRAATTMADRP